MKGLVRRGVGDVGSPVVVEPVATRHAAGGTSGVDAGPWRRGTA